MRNQAYEAKLSNNISGKFCVFFATSRMLTYPFTVVMNTPWSWSMILLVCCWNWFASDYLNIFTSGFIKKYWSIVFFPCFFVSFGDQGNTGIIKRIWQHSFFLNFLEKFENNWNLLFFTCFVDLAVWQSEWSFGMGYNLLCIHTYIHTWIG